MKKYTLEKINVNNLKHFSIELGLLPGYKKGTEYTILDVIKIYKDWLNHKLENDFVAIPVKISPTNFIYGFKSKEIIVNNENAVSIQGEITQKYCSDIFNDDNKLLEIIVEIATILGQKLKQERVHIMFNNEKYILE